MPIEPTTLDALMARLADGDREVFARVFEALWSPVHRLCISLLKNEADASDAAQEAMSKTCCAARSSRNSPEHQPHADGASTSAATKR